MKRSIAAAAIAGTLLTGVGVGATVLGPFSAVAEDAPAGEAKSPTSWISNAIAKLVGAGTINRSQGDAVIEALKEARPERGPGGPGRPGPGARMGLATAAKALGMEEQALAEALRGGKSLAEVARDRNVDVARVIDALVAEAEAHLEEAVKNGRIPQERADEIRNGIRERVTARVNGEGPRRGPDGNGPQGDGPHGRGPGRGGPEGGGPGGGGPEGGRPDADGQSAEGQGGRVQGGAGERQ